MNNSSSQRDEQQQFVVIWMLVKPEQRDHRVELLVNMQPLVASSNTIWSSEHTCTCITL